jgi:NADPH:quinone reductase
VKAITLAGIGPPESFTETDLPIQEPAAGEVLVKIYAGSINPIDYKIRQGRIGATFPLVLGHDCSGSIAALGSDVTRFQIGDEVWVYLGGPCSNGGYAEYTTVPHQFVSRKPRNLDFFQAAAIPVVGLTSYQSIHAKLKPAIDDSVFVAGGSGGLGSVALQLLQTAGLSGVLTTAGPDASAEYLTETLGVAPEHVIRYQGKSHQELVEEALSRNSGKPFKKILDFVGGDMKKLCSDLLAADGEIVSVVEDDDSFAVPLWHGRGLFAEKESWDVYHQDLEHLLRLFEQQRLHPVKVEKIGHLSPQTIANGHSRLESGAIQGKLVFEV